MKFKQGVCRSHRLEMVGEEFKVEGLTGMSHSTSVRDRRTQTSEKLNNQKTSSIWWRKKKDRNKRSWNHCRS